MQPESIPAAPQRSPAKDGPPISVNDLRDVADVISPPASEPDEVRADDVGVHEEMNLREAGNKYGEYQRKKAEEREQWRKAVHGEGEQHPVEAKAEAAEIERQRLEVVAQERAEEAQRQAEQVKPPTYH